MTFEELVALGGAWAWANYGKELVKELAKDLLGNAGDKTKKALSSGWDRIQWDEAAEKYQKKILDLHSTIRVIGKADPVSLEGLFTDVFILNRPTAHERFDIRHLRREPGLLDHHRERQSGLSLVEDPSKKRLFILGKPGSGKTTFLKYVTLQAASGAIDRIPIFISLERWAKSGLELLPYICLRFEICGFPNAEQFVVHVLQKGAVVAMFDGLDEVRQEAGQRDRMILEIRDFCDQYHEMQCLITCRIAAVEYEFETFTYVELADFSDAQIDSFVSKWFGQEPEKLQRFKYLFAQWEHAGLRELAKTPLLLTLLCLSFGETMTFPQRRSEIYEEAVDALLKKWDASRSIHRDEIYHGLSLGRKRQMLMRIAAQSFQLNEYFLPQKQLAGSITSYLRLLPGGETADPDDGEVVLKAIEAQHGILVERAHRIYSFSHLTLQEYFTARYIYEHASAGVMRELLHPRYVPDARWREVILITAGMLENADEFFKVFEQTLSRLLEDEPGLAKFFVPPAYVPDTEWLKGLLYCCVVLARGYLFNWKGNVQTYISHRTYEALGRLDLFFNLPLFEMTGVLTFSLGPHDSSSHSLSSDLDVNLIYSLALADRMLSQSANFAELNNKAIDYFERVLKLIESEGDRDLVIGWEAMMSSTLDSDGSVWLKNREQIHGFIRSRRFIGTGWALSDNVREERITEYIYSKNLLLECLKVAAVTNRKELEMRYI
jgi:hypothetical protein